MTPLEHAARELMRESDTLVEELRMAEVNQLLKKLGKEPEDMFLDIAWLASQICETPLAAVSIVGHDTAYYKGLVIDNAKGDVESFDRARVVCKLVIANPTESTIIYNAGSDERVKDFPFISGERDFFSVYAGLPIVTPTGNAVGTICVMDRVNRKVTEDQMKGLDRLRRLALNLILD